MEFVLWTRVGLDAGIPGSTKVYQMNETMGRPVSLEVVSALASAKNGAQPIQDVP